MSENKIVDIVLGEQIIAPTAAIENERKVAIFDLLESNEFYPISPNADRPLNGPYALKLDIYEGQLLFEVEAQGSQNTQNILLSLTPFRQVIKDYYEICQAYFQAVETMPPSQIEAIDMGRRGIHDEGSRLLIERLEGKAVLDHATARRLFTLISIFQFRG